MTLRKTSNIDVINAAKIISEIKSSCIVTSPAACIYTYNKEDWIRLFLHIGLGYGCALYVMSYVKSVIRYWTVNIVTGI